MPSFSKKNLVIIISLLVVLLSLPLAIFLVQQRQVRSGTEGNYIALKQEVKAQPSEGKLQFKSGFEENTVVNSSIRGTDLTAPEGINSWDDLTTYLDWMVVAQSYFQGGSMGLAPDPTNPNNKVLRLETTGASI